MDLDSHVVQTSSDLISAQHVCNVAQFCHWQKICLQLAINRFGECGLHILTRTGLARRIGSPTVSDPSLSRTFQQPSSLPHRDTRVWIYDRSFQIMQSQLFVASIAAEPSSSRDMMDLSSCGQSCLSSLFRHLLYP